MREHEQQYWAESKARDKASQKVADIAYEHGFEGKKHRVKKLADPHHQDIYDVSYGMGKDKV